MYVELKNASLQQDGVSYVDNVSIRFEEGLNVLLGPTLSGKTSLMRVMAGLEKLDSGSVFYDGKDMHGVAIQKRNIAMVYQQFINYPGLTVYENIASPLRLLKKPKKLIDEKVRWAASVLKLDNMLDRLPLELSGGQQQRCALARAIVKEARLVLLDEPLANLDYKLREELRDELPQIFAQSKSVLIYATSEPEEALKLNGNTAVMHQGAIAQFGFTNDVYHQPQTKQAAEIFSDPPMNFIEVKISNKSLSFACNTEKESYQFDKANGLKDGVYIAGFRPNHLSIVNSETADKATDNNSVNFNCHAIISELTGSMSYIHVDVQSNAAWLASANIQDHQELKRWVSLNHGIHHIELDSQLVCQLDMANMYLYSLDGGLVFSANARRNTKEGSQ